MDNKEKLINYIEKAEFSSAIALVDSLNDESLYIFKAISLLGSAKIDEALKFITKNNRVLLKYEPVMTIKAHVSIYIETEDYVTAMEVLNHYQNEPYISQEVEELFPTLRDAIKAAQKEKFAPKKDVKAFSLEEIKHVLETSEDPDELMKVLHEGITKKNLPKILPSLKTFLLRESKEINVYSVKAFSLAILSDIPFDEEIEIRTKIDGIQKVIPSRLVPPYLLENGKNIIAKIEELSDRDISIQKNAEALYNSYFMLRIPVDIFSEYHYEDLAEAFVTLAKRYMGQEAKADEITEQIIAKIGQILS